jgi:hypothetical protein
MVRWISVTNILSSNRLCNQCGATRHRRLQVSHWIISASQASMCSIAVRNFWVNFPSRQTMAFEQKSKSASLRDLDALLEQERYGSAMT